MTVNLLGLFKLNRRPTFVQRRGCHNGENRATFLELTHRQSYSYR
jgi:hypothetical protein